jgi:hypothetical protein
VWGVLPLLLCGRLLLLPMMLISRRARRQDGGMVAVLPVQGRHLLHTVCRRCWQLLLVMAPHEARHLCGASTLHTCAHTLCEVARYTWHVPNCDVTPAS